MVNEQTVKPDIIIPNTSGTNIRYVLWRDKEKGLAWWRVGGRNIQEGDGKDVLSAVWGQGWSGGMGETQRIAPNSFGYAYSERIDCSSYGFARLSETPVAITPTESCIENIASCKFEEGGYVYLGQQSELLKIDVTNKSIIERVTKTNGLVGRAAEFEGKWYVPWGGSVVFAELTTQATALDYHYYYNGSTFTDNSAAAKEVDGSAFTLLSGASDYAYWGCAATFTRLGFDIDTAGAGATVSWQYWNGATWAALTVTDGTTNFTADGQVSWTAPGDWATTAVNSQTKYWVRAVPSGAFGTAPTAKWASTADTWTDADAATYALHFAAIQDGGTAKLARAYSTNLVALAATAPLTSGSWGSGFEVGDTSYAITGLAENAAGLFVAKRDNLYVFATPGVATPIFNLPSLQNSANGIGMVAIPGTEVAIYNHISGLWAVIGQRVRRIGPDTIPTLQEVPNVTGEPYRGYHYHTVVVGAWIYSTYVTPDSNATYLLAGQMVDGLERIIWHTAQSFSTEDIGGLFVDTGNKMWVYRSSGIRYYQLNKDGSPNADYNTAGRGAASTTHRLFLSEVHLDTPMTNKQLMAIEAKLRGAGATCPLQLQIMRDGAAPANVGATITSSGVSQRYWTLGTNDTSIDARVVASITTTAEYAPASSDLQIWGIALRVVPRPTRGDKVQIIIDCLKPYANGSAQIDSPLTIRATLQALENAAPVSCKDPNGNTVVLQILSVNDAGVFWNPDGTISYLLEIEAAEFVNA